MDKTHFRFSFYTGIFIITLILSSSIWPSATTRIVQNPTCFTVDRSKFHILRIFICVNILILHCNNVISCYLPKNGFFYLWPIRQIKILKHHPHIHFLGVPFSNNITIRIKQIEISYPLIWF